MQDAESLKSITNLNEKQREYIRDHCYKLFEVTMLPPNDFPFDIVSSSCACCQERKKFMEELLALGG